MAVRPERHGVTHFIVTTPRKCSQISSATETPVRYIRAFAGKRRWAHNRRPSSYTTKFTSHLPSTVMK